MHEARHQSQCYGTTQRTKVGRDVGKGFRVRVTHVYLWAVHVNVWQKPSQYCKVIILQVKEINKKINLLICKKRKKPAT